VATDIQSPSAVIASARGDTEGGDGDGGR